MNRLTRRETAGPIRRRCAGIAANGYLTNKLRGSSL
jgi:hypothetical protein